jgi:uncharacterized protein (DUF342 family)
LSLRVKFLLPKKDEGSEEERVNFFERGLVLNVKKGQVLAEGEGDDFDPSEFPKGENVYVPPENPRVLVSAVDGCAFFKDGKIHVSPLYEVNGDIDHLTGNVHFVGTLLIKGTVRESFLVEAKEAEIRGDIEGTVFTRKNLLVKGGIVSKKHKVISGGNLKASYILSSKVEAFGDIEVSKFIRESEIKAGGSIIVSGEPGAIIGGSLWAQKGIRANVVGSSYSAHTTIRLGIDPFLEILIQSHLQTIQEEKELILGILEDKDLPFEERFQYERKLLELDFQTKLLEEALYRNLEKAFLEVKKKVFQGVTLMIGHHTLRIEEDMEGPLRFFLKDDKIELERWT